jgi:AraC-like DNA-binding protein
MISHSVFEKEIYMRQASDEISRGENTVTADVEGSAVNVVARVRRRLFLGSDGGLPATPTEPVARSVHFVEMHFGRQITLDDMAAAAGISKFYFSREFKDQTGLAPGEFLRGYRVVHAMDELLSSTERIGEIALATGYQNAAAFSRAFRKVTGSTPYLFRMTRITRADERDLRGA